jgi:nitrite reductase/ring-hydroxylating ferredoxin subunit
MIEASVLRLAGTYRRRVNASLERIWENVFDWEHLAHLHDGSFSDCVLVDSGPWGWCADLTTKGGTPQRIELRANRAAGRYVSTTTEGSTKGTEIRVSLEPIDTNLVDVTVEFHLPETRPDRLAALGAAYSAVYAKLWDEDEVMMQARERALARRTTPDRTAPPLDLGEEQAVRAKLPMQFELGGAMFRVIDLEGSLMAHSAVCPHWLGPLDADPVVDGSIRCPWHGYVFDLVDGRCRSQPALKLAVPPVVRMIEGRVVAAWR